MKTIKTLLAIFVSAMLVFSMTACSLQGMSAYELAVENGYNGTEEEWLLSLKGAAGADGVDGKNFNVGYTAYDLYEEAVNNGGYTGTFLEFIDEYFSADTVEQTVNAVNDAVFSVCSIYCTFKITTGRGFYQQTYTSTSAGSGVIISVDKDKGDALIVTNYHVVYNASATGSNKISDDISIFLYGNERSEGAIKCQFVGGTAQYDLALLKVTSSALISSGSARAVTFADSDDVCLGQTVIAIGNPEAEGISVTKGILSVDSENISIEDVTGDKNEIRVLRYDASVNPGNSGGGLFNSDGELIGIVNAKTVDEEVDNMNYAIPSNTVSGVVSRLVDYCLGTTNTKLYRAYLGIETQTISSSGVYNKEKNRVEIIETVQVKSVSSGALAYGKLKSGDTVVSLSYKGKQKDVTRNYQLIDAVLSLGLGDTITFTVIRDGERVEVPMTVTESSLTAIG